MTLSKRERIDPRVIIEHVTEPVESDLGKRNHHLATSLPNEPIWPEDGSGRLEQVIVYLLVNCLFPPK